MIRMISFFAEHMEEDDPTPRALPRWVELEYQVSEHHAHSQVVSMQTGSPLMYHNHSTCARSQDPARP
jgi:hypothetical protein